MSYMTTQAESGSSRQSDSSKTVRMVIKGRVQGVCYRNWTVENTEQLGIKGWVRNRRDGLAIWVETNYHRLMKSTSMDIGIEEMFEIESEVEGLAEDEAIEDVLRVLEEAAERGELEIGSYLKQVRVLAREQFFIRHNGFKVEFSDQSFL